MSKHENRLIHERSPYLQQHAHNPVDWYPWSQEAFDRAKNEDKPVFLSIGYSTCHWCHVMERESFENEDVASAMNANFVCIKVDREERPDIDNFYMSASQILTGSGGWPLNVIVTPDRKPVFAMTYIPKNSRGEQMGIIDLSNAIGELWKNSRAELIKKGSEVVSRLTTAAKKNSGDLLDQRFLKDSFSELAENFDETNGGFGVAPKFPTPHYLLFLMRYYHRYGDRKALDMVVQTIEKMSMGGIYDHVGNGFHRYSTDAGWILPHFEKMLYDQGMLIIALSELYSITHKRQYGDLILKIVDFLKREMHSDAGGFFTAIDADSEGIEGKFYTWSYNEIIGVLGENDGEFASEVFNADMAGNYHDESSGRNTGKNILYRDSGIEQILGKHNLTEEQFQSKLDECKEKLFDARLKRVRPSTDMKVISALNGIMISAMAGAYKATGNKELLDLAVSTADFILERLDAGQDRIFHTYCEGTATVEGFIDDYAYMIQGLIDLYETTFDVRHLKNAIRINKRALVEFLDTDDFGFYFTAKYRNELGQRRKEGYDGAIPSGNSVQVLNLLRLSQILENDDFETIAKKSINSFYDTVSRAPVFHLYLMCAVDLAIGPPVQVKIFRGSDGVADAMIEHARSEYSPEMSLVVVDESNKEFFKDVYTVTGSNVTGKSSATVCRDYSCLPGTDSLDTFKKQIKG